MKKIFLLLLMSSLISNLFGQNEIETKYLTVKIAFTYKGTEIDTIYGDTIPNKAYIDGLVGTIVSYNRDSIYQYEIDSSLARLVDIPDGFNRDSVHNYEIDSGLARQTDIIPYPDLTQNEDVNIDAGYLRFLETGNSSYFKIAYNGFSSGYYTANVGHDFIFDYNTFHSSLQDWTNYYYADINSQVNEGSNATINIYVTDPLSNEAKINFHTSNGITITDDILSKGLIYNADYSTNYTDRSIPDKGYVDGLIEIKVATLNISSSNLLNGDSLQILAAPGAGKMIIPISITLYFNEGGSSYTGSGTSEIKTYTSGIAYKIYNVYSACFTGGYDYLVTSGKGNTLYIDGSPDTFEFTLNEPWWIDLATYSSGDGVATIKFYYYISDFN